MPRLTLKRTRELVLRHMHFVGPGLVSSVAYIDPGNWATDLSAGAMYGYKLLFIVLVSGLAAVVLQLLAVRLGAVTTTSLPTQIRLLFERMEHRRPRFKWAIRAGLYSLYALAELAIISTDLAELLGSAIALNLLFPRLPLYAGVLITAADVLIVLLFFRSSGGRQGMLMFEIVIVSLVLAVFVCFAILLHLVQPDWGQVFLGLVPSKTLVNPGALYVGVGIIGATVMPHALILGSALAGVDRLDMVPQPPREPGEQTRMERARHRMPGVGRAVWARLKGRRGDAEEAGRGGAGAGMEMEVEVEMDTRGGAHGSHMAQPERLVDQLPVLGSSTAPASPGLNGPEQGQDAKVRDLPIEGHDAPLGSSTRAEHAEAAEEDDSGSKQARAKSMRAYEHSLRSFDRIRWVELHLLHATIDTSYSLLGFALTINAAILSLAGAAYYYGRTGPTSDADLPGAHALISEYIGRGAGLIFALSLLCAGQSASITATLAGQVVSEGFIQWRTSPLVRRMVTRLIGVVPAAVVAAALGAQGLNTMLVASQVILSIILPTVIFPLVYIANREEVMTVQGPEVEMGVGTGAGAETTTSSGPGAGEQAEGPTPTSTLTHRHAQGSVGGPLAGPNPPVDTSPPTPTPTPQPRPRRTKSFRSPMWVTVLGYALFGVVILANMYVIVELGLGQD